MKATFHKIKPPVESSFTIRKDSRETLSDKWHYHEMIELVYIERGSGLRYVGDSVERFSDGDIILVGKRLPHLWRSGVSIGDKIDSNIDDEHNSKLSGKLEESSNSVDIKSDRCITYVINFSETFLGRDFITLPELNKIRDLIYRSQRGIKFRGDVDIYRDIKTTYNHTGIERLISMINILNRLSKIEEYTLLSSQLFNESIYDKDITINRIFQYIMDNFTEDISLDRVAEVANMNRCALCKYIKRKTKKTFTKVLNEIRIGYACKLIQDENINISDAAFMSGYSSISHFNKQFKLIKGVNPSSYRDELQSVKRLN